MSVSLKVTVYGEKYGVLSHEVLLKNRSRTVFLFVTLFQNVVLTLKTLFAGWPHIAPPPILIGVHPKLATLCATVFKKNLKTSCVTVLLASSGYQDVDYEDAI